MSENNFPLVSIIVVSQNESHIVVESIKSLLNLDYPNFEIIFVDGFSSDGTYGKVKEMSHSFQKIKTFQLEGNISKARNFAISKSNGDIIASIDADIIVESSWLKNLVQGLNKDSETVAVGGSYIPVHKKINNYVQIADELRSTLIGSGGDTTTYRLEDQAEIKGSLAACNCAFYKSVFEKLGGYDEELIACEDADFAFRIKRNGMKIRYVSNATVEHYVKYNTLKEYLGFIWKYGKVRGIAVKKHFYLFTKPQIAVTIFMTIFLGSLLFWAITGEAILFLGVVFLYISSLFSVTVYLSIKHKSLKLILLGYPITLLQNLAYNISFMWGLLFGKQKKWDISKR